MFVLGVVLLLLGPIVLVLSIVTFRPQGIIAVIPMTLGGWHLCRSYWSILRSNEVSYRMDINTYRGRFCVRFVVVSLHL
jgi:hypothetical protein